LLNEEELSFENKYWTNIKNPFKFQNESFECINDDEDDPKNEIIF
jgi:hypothetical protein